MREPHPYEDELIEVMEKRLGAEYDAYIIERDFEALLLRAPLLAIEVAEKISKLAGRRY